MKTITTKILEVVSLICGLCIGVVLCSNYALAQQVVSVPFWAAGTLGAMANYGTSPGAVLVPGVNAYVTNQAVINTASVSSWSTGTALNTVVTVPDAGNYPANQLSLSASANVTAGAVTFQGTKADGTDETIPVAQVLNPNTLAPLTNPYTLTTSKQDFLIVSQGYQTIKVKLTTAITTSSGAGTTVISNTNLPYNPVVSALLNPLTDGSAIIGKVGIDQTTPGTTNAVQTIPGTTGGLSVYFVQPAASDNHAVIKAGAGQVYKITVTNNSATVNYLRLYNATTGFNGCNSATNLVYQIAIPASTSVGGLSDSWINGMTFATGISICVTSGYATTDTTNATASAMSVNIGYK